MRSTGGVADYSGITYEKIERQHGVFWPCPSEDHPGTPRLFEPGSWNPVAQGQRAVLLPRRQGPLQRRRLHAAGRGRRRRVSGDPDDRPGGQPVPVRHADPAHRPAGGPVPGAARRDAPAAGRTLGIADGDWATVESRRGDCTLRAQVVDNDPAGHGLHPLPLGRRARASTS